MSLVQANGIQLEVEKKGDHGNEAIVLIRGLGTQLIDWPMPFIDSLVDAGFYVVYFDNRDVGLSQNFDESGIPTMEKIASGEQQAAYSLHDMADDVVGVMDTLGIAKAHVFGISMGGMIVQVLAAAHGDRLLSMIAVMSSSSRPGLPAATPEAWASLGGEPDEDAGLEAIDLFHAEGLAICGSPAYPQSLEERLDIVRRRRERNHNPGGVSRQMAAVVSIGSRVEMLASITVPCMVIHGADDPLIPKEGGEDIAACIPECDLHIIPGMGHNIPDGVIPILLELVLGFCNKIRAK